MVGMKLEAMTEVMAEERTEVMAEEMTEEITGVARPEQQVTMPTLSLAS